MWGELHLFFFSIKFSIAFLSFETRVLRRFFSQSVFFQLAINLLYMCTTAISIGFHLAGQNTAKKNAIEVLFSFFNQLKLEMHLQIAEVLDESPSIENDPTIPPPEKRLMPSGKVDMIL